MRSGSRRAGRTGSISATGSRPPEKCRDLKRKGPETQRDGPAPESGGQANGSRRREKQTVAGGWGARFARRKSGGPPGRRALSGRNGGSSLPGSR